MNNINEVLSSDIKTSIGEILDIRFSLNHEAVSVTDLLDQMNNLIKAHLNNELPSYGDH